MTDLLLQMGLSNACFALALAIVAMVVGAATKRPHLAHLLWLLVFVKLVTPPIVTILEVTIPGQPEAAVAINNHSRSGLPVAASRELDVDEQPDASLSARIGSVLNHGREWLPPIWLLGSVVVFGWSLVRVCRFGRLLAAESEVAPQQLQAAAVKIARRLELKTIPTICTTSARLSPMVWWAGGKVRIVIPATLFDQMDQKQWQWILAHELAHVRRRDYLVRWLEWLACVGFWWNPVVWWAQRNLRATEEICCDALVLCCLNPKPHSYANSLLTAVEFLACPALRPPAMASEINSGGFQERRFRMIVSETPNRVTSRWLQACVLLCAVVVLPFGMAYAQDYNAVEKRLGEAVSKGELTLEQAGAMMAAIKKEMAPEAGDEREIHAYFERVWAKLQAAVAEGKMSAEDAEAKMSAIKKAKMGAGKKDADYKAIGEKIEAAVKAGKLTEAEARAKWAAIKKAADAKKDQGSDRAKAYLMKVKKELGAAIEAGRISEEDAKRRYQGAEKAIKERMAGARGEGRSRAIGREDRRAQYEGFERRIKAAVREGKMTRVEAGEQLEGLRRRMEMAERSERGERSITVEEYKRAEAKMRKMVEDGKAKPEDVEKRLIEMRKMIVAEKAPARRKGLSIEDYKQAEAKMKKMIEDGKAKPEDVEKRLIEMRKMMGDQGERGDRKRPDWEGIKRRIEGAVERGDMTREEADAKYKEIREGMAKRRER